METFIGWLPLGSLGVTILGFWLAYHKYTRDREKDMEDRQRARENTIERDAAHHAENTEKMNTLLNFQREQLVINRQRDQQIAELREHTTQLKAQTRAIEDIAKIMNRRLERLEDKP